MSHPSITAVVICEDEERHIAECLESVAWCDEIVVVDSGSSDRTLELARKRATRVLQRDWTGIADQKNFALAQATADWVLNLDADERCTPGLRHAALAAIAAEAAPAGFEVRRHAFYLGRWIDHGGWHPDWKLRLFRRERGRFVAHGPHDRVVVEGPVARLDAELVHLTYGDFSDHIRTLQRFSDVVATDWAREGRRFSLARAVAHPVAKFVECWVWKQGFRDGWPGFVIAATSAFYVFAKHVKLREKTLAR